MSLIYAHKTNFGIRILSDSKLTVAVDDKDRLKSILSKQEFDNIIRYGVIKTVIYQPSITISAAGILEHFNELLGYLQSNRITIIDEILKKTEEIHNKYNRDTDFIITTKDTIYEIKNGQYQIVDFSWIGDKDAFSKFQEEKFKYIFDEKKYSSEMLTESEIQSLEEIDKVEFSLKKVIENQTIDSVGGFLVICALSENTNFEYEYFSRFCSFSGFDSIQTLNPGENVVFFHKISDGGFSCQILDSKSKFLVYLNQINIGIVYDNGYSDEKYSNLLLPFIVNCSYEEFINEYSDIQQSIQIN